MADVIAQAFSGIVTVRSKAPAGKDEAAVAARCSGRGPQGAVRRATLARQSGKGLLERGDSHASPATFLRMLRLSHHDGVGLVCPGAGRRAVAQWLARHCAAVTSPAWS
jgi:hypothetical protein